jgi:hypothetical protein
MEGRNLCNPQAPAPANAAMDGGCSGFRLYPAWPPPRTTSRMLAHGGSASPSTNEHALAPDPRSLIHALARPPPRTRKTTPHPLHRSPSALRSSLQIRSPRPQCLASVLYLCPTTREIGIASPRRPPPKWCRLRSGSPFLPLTSSSSCVS